MLRASALSRLCMFPNLDISIVLIEAEKWLRTVVADGR